MRYRLLATAGFLLLLQPQAQALQYFYQAPCKNVPRFCLTFTSANATPITFRSFSFKAGKRGKAKVSFHGALTCYNQDSNVTGVSIETQIVRERDRHPSDLAESGLFHTATLAAPALVGGTTWEGSTTFNLASSRVFDIAHTGDHRFYFNATAPLNNVLCGVNNAAFTVEFQPN